MTNRKCSQKRILAFKALTIGLASLMLVFVGSSNTTLAGGDPPLGFTAVIIRGQASLCTDGKPLQGVRVTAFSEKNPDLTSKTTTDDKGQFSLTAILFGAHAQAALSDLILSFSGFTTGEMQSTVINVPFPVPTSFISVSTCVFSLDRGPDQNVQCCEERLRFDDADFIQGKTEVLQAPPDPPFRVVELKWRVHIRWFCSKKNIPECIGTFNVAHRFTPAAGTPAPSMATTTIDSLEAKCDGRHKSGTINVTYTATFPTDGVVEGTVELTFTPKSLGGVRKGNHQATLKLPFRASGKDRMEYGDQELKEGKIP